MSDVLVQLLLESSARVFLVAAFLAAVLAFARVRSPGLQHTVWTAVLGAMLLMPVLFYMVPAVVGIPIPNFSWDSPTVSLVGRLEPKRGRESATPGVVPLPDTMLREAMSSSHARHHLP